MAASSASSSSSSSSSGSEAGSDSESIQRRTIRESYAKAIALKRKREEEDEERRRKQARVVEQSGEEESEDDDDGWDEGPAADAALLKTLALLKKKDPTIYDPSKPIFEDARKQLSELSRVVRRVHKAKETKPMTYKTQAAAALLGHDEDVEVPQPLTHVQEQEALRFETISAFHEAVGDEDDLFTLRAETKDDADMEQEEYQEFIQREVGEVLPTTTDRNDAASDEADKFLTNYLLNRSWIDHKARRLPTFDEVTSKGKGRATDSLDVEGEEEDSDFEELEEDFEATYNFRYEEPDGTKIPRYPREIDSLARRKESKRKEARERKKARKEEELQKKKEEVRHMKNVKSKELKNKVLELLGGSSGDGDRKAAKKALASFNLDDDFDPTTWDQQMASLYENEDDEDLDKPDWQDDDDIYPPEGDEDAIEPEQPPIEDAAEDEDAAGSSRKRKKKKKKKSGDTMETPVVDMSEMDADAQFQMPSSAPVEEEWDGTEEMRKRVLDQYMDEIYKMDFNDMVGDMPTRFKYTPVAKSKYGLTATQILLATDKELNSYVGMKSLAPHKKRDTWDTERGKKLGDFKKAISGRTWGYAGRPSRLPASGSSGSRSTAAAPKRSRNKQLKKGKREREAEKAARSTSNVES